MKTITVLTYYHERSNKHEKATAIVVDALPKVGDHVSFIYNDEIVNDVCSAWIDNEQPTSDVWNYDIYQIEICDAENPEDIDFILLAVEREEPQDDPDNWDRWECEPSRDDWDTDEDY